MSGSVRSRSPQDYGVTWNALDGSTGSDGCWSSRSGTHLLRGAHRASNSTEGADAATLTPGRHSPGRRGTIMRSRRSSFSFSRPAPTMLWPAVLCRQVAPALRPTPPGLEIVTWVLGGCYQGLSTWCSAYPADGGQHPCSSWLAARITAKRARDLHFVQMWIAGRARLYGFLIDHELRRPGRFRTGNDSAAYQDPRHAARRPELQPDSTVRPAWPLNPAQCASAASGSARGPGRDPWVWDARLWHRHRD
jgi:hypothetical protein